MQIIRQVIDLLHPPVAKNMVDVGVRSQQMRGFEVVGFDEVL